MFLISLRGEKERTIMLGSVTESVRDRSQNYRDDPKISNHVKTKICHAKLSRVKRSDPKPYSSIRSLRTTVPNRIRDCVTDTIHTHILVVAFFHTQSQVS